MFYATLLVIEQTLWVKNQISWALAGGNGNIFSVVFDRYDKVTGLITGQADRFAYLDILSSFSFYRLLGRTTVR